MSVTGSGTSSNCTLIDSEATSSSRTGSNRGSRTADAAAQLAILAQCDENRRGCLQLDGNRLRRFDQLARPQIGVDRVAAQHLDIERDVGGAGRREGDDRIADTERALVAEDLGLEICRTPRAEQDRKRA